MDLRSREDFCAMLLMLCKKYGVKVSPRDRAMILDTYSKNRDFDCILGNNYMLFVHTDPLRK